MDTSKHVYKERNVTQRTVVSYAHEQTEWERPFSINVFAGLVISFEIIYPKPYKNWSNSMNAFYSKYEMNL